MTAFHENCLGMNKTTRLILHQYHPIVVQLGNISSYYQNSIYFSSFLESRSSSNVEVNAKVKLEHPFDPESQPTFVCWKKMTNKYHLERCRKCVSKFTTPVLDWYSKRKIMNGICLFTNKLRFVHAKYHLEVLSSLLLAYLSFLYRLSQMCHHYES